MKMKFLFLIAVVICIKSLNGFQSSVTQTKQIRCLNLYLNPSPILHNDKQSHNLLQLDFKKDQKSIISQDIDNIVTIAPSSTINKGTDLLINVLYKGLLIEPVFGSLGLLKSSDDIKKEKDLKILTIPSLTRSNKSYNNNNQSNEPFESKLASMMSLEEETILNQKNLKDNVLSVTMAPKSKFSSASSSSSSSLKSSVVTVTSTTSASSSSSSSSSLKKADFKDESWVVRKLKEIRTREIEVARSSSSSATSTAAAAATSVVTKSPPNTSGSSMSKASISTNGVSAIAAATPVKSTFISKTPTSTSPSSSVGVSTNAVRTPSPTMVTNSNSEKFRAAVSNFFSPSVSSVILPSDSVTTKKIATAAAEAVAMATSTTSSSLASSSTTSSSSTLQSDSLYELMPTSIITEGFIYGNVDKNAVDFDISADTFKLPIIAISENTEFAAAQQAIKTAGVSGTLAYALSEVGFWVVSLPIIISSYHTSTNEWLSLGNPTDRSIIFGLSAGFMSVARLALPFRLAVAVGLTPVVDKLFTKKFLHGDGNSEGSDSINMKDVKIAPPVVTNTTPPLLVTPSPIASAVNNGFGSREPWLIRKFKEMRSSASSASRV